MKQVPKCTENVISLSRNFFKKGLLGHLTDVFRKYGDIVDLKVPPKMFAVGHPRFAKHIYYTNPKNYFQKQPLVIKMGKDWLTEAILVANNNYDQWKKDRPIAETSFELSHFRNYSSTLVQNCLEMMKNFERAAKEGIPIEINEQFFKLAMRNVGTTIFDNLQFDYDVYEKAINTLMPHVYERFFAVTDLWWQLPTKRKRIWDHALQQLNDQVIPIIEARMQQTDVGNDMLGNYLRAYTDEKDKKEVIRKVKQHVHGIILGGYETISTVLSWAFAVLSLYPAVEQKLCQEIDTVLQGRLPTYDDLVSLKYTKAFFSEVLRLYAPLPFGQPRVAAEDDEMEGFSIPKGTSIVVSIYHIHRHPDFWENPLGFDPERFIKSPWVNHNHFAFIPGIAGERQCPGINFAMIEGYLTLATVLQQYRLSLLPGASVIPEVTTTYHLGKESSKMMVKKVT